MRKAKKINVKLLNVNLKIIKKTLFNAIYLVLVLHCKIIGAFDLQTIRLILK